MSSNARPVLNTADDTVWALFRMLSKLNLTETNRYFTMSYGLYDAFLGRFVSRRVVIPSPEGCVTIDP